MHVLFAPDWRTGNPYQSFLAASLSELGVQVEFLSTYRRGLPLARGVHGSKADVLHLHWPEAYFPQTDTIVGFFRTLKFPLDLRLALKRRALVVTAHNLFPHNWRETPLYLRAYASAYRKADRVIAHSEGARSALVAKYGLRAERISVIPHGDLSPPNSPLPDRAAARAALGLPENRQYVVMFGRVVPYKGIAEVLEYWRRSNPRVTLLVAGESPDPHYTSEILRIASGAADVVVKLERLSEEGLRLVLAGSSAALFNYQQILTSGGASLARSYGLPVILPSRLETVDLMEPDGRVLRFDSLDDLPALIEQAIRVGSDYGAAMPYREHCSWRQIAKKTIDAYSEALLSGKARQ